MRIARYDIPSAIAPPESMMLKKRHAHRHRVLTIAAGVTVFVVAVLLIRTLRLPTPSRSRPAGTGVDGTIVVFHAGSLTRPFQELAEAYKARHPRARVLLEAAGSRHCARKIIDLNRRADVFGSADYRVVENLLIPEHARFNIHFAVNEMVIAFTDHSRRHSEITQNNWHEVLLDSEVRFGRSDPNSDPCGYRTEMVFQLAEQHLEQIGLADRLTSKHGETFIRPKETDLLALLEAGEIDYLPIYRSVALQRGLRFVPLAPEVNLGDPAQASRYRSARVTVTGKTPGSFIDLVGEPIVYSLTIPTDAPNPVGAVEFIALALGPEGRSVFEENGQRPIVSPRVTGAEALPEKLLGMLPDGVSR